MRTLKRLFARVRNFAIGRRGDERLREEIESHIVSGRSASDWGSGFRQQLEQDI